MYLANSLDFNMLLKCFVFLQSLIFHPGIKIEMKDFSYLVKADKSTREPVNNNADYCLLVSWDPFNSVVKVNALHPGDYSTLELDTRGLSVRDFSPKKEIFQWKDPKKGQTVRIRHILASFLGKGQICTHFWKQNRY